MPDVLRIESLLRCDLRSEIESLIRLAAWYGLEQGSSLDEDEVDVEVEEEEDDDEEEEERGEEVASLRAGR